MDHMKMLVIVQNLSIGGVQRLIVDQVQELQERGHEVWLIFFEDTGDIQMKSELVIPSSRLIFIDYKRMRDIKGFLEMLKSLRKIKPDVVLTHLWFANTVGRIASFISSVPFVISFEHSTYDTVKSRRQFFFDWVLQYVSSYVVAVSSAVEYSLISHGIQKKKIRVIKNGIYLEKFTSSFQQEPAYFLYVGRLVYDKGVDVLLQALALVKEVKLVIVGDGPEKENLVKLAQKLHLDERVSFVGSQKSLNHYFEKAIALILPSRREGFGLVLIEALAASVPVIGTNIGGIIDIIKNEENGFLIPPNNVSELASAMKHMLQKNVRKPLALHAPTSATSFSIHTHVDELLNLLEV